MRFLFRSAQVRSSIGLPRRRGVSRRGAILTLIALLLPVMIVLLGFAVDLAHMQSTRAELRAAADSAARAGADALSRTDSVASAVSTARQMASRNSVAGVPLRLEAADIQIGRSLPNASGKWVFDANGSPANSVRVVARRTVGSLDGRVPLFFGSLVGVAGFEPEQTVTASFLNVDICLVLDRSTSMKLDANSPPGGMSVTDPRFCAPPLITSRWGALDAAVRVFIDELESNTADEQVGLVTYSSGETGTLGSYCGMSSQPSRIDRELDEDLGRVTSAMNDLMSTVWNGNTHISAGMMHGIDVLTRTGRSREHADRIMIVMTDGYQNRGNAVTAAGSCAANRITVHTITFGASADIALMGSVAAAGKGRHYHAANPEELREVFRELAAMLAIMTE